MSSHAKMTKRQEESILNFQNGNYRRAGSTENVQGSGGVL
jgi:hypothetical protein